jgi:hypothetical protein
MIPGGLMLIGLFFLKESPRWLTKKGRHQEAAKSLAWVRCATVDDPDVLLELAEVRASIEEELNSTEGVTWKECLQPGSRKRFFIAFMIMFWQQFSGNSSLRYLSDNCANLYYQGPIALDITHLRSLRQLEFLASTLHSLLQASTEQ